MMDVNKALLVWFTQVRTANTSVDGPLPLEKANELAKNGNTESISKTWIERWKKRHGISQSSIVREAAIQSLNGDTLPGLLRKYNSMDIYKMYKTGLLYRLLTDETLHFKPRKRSGGKQSKEKITLALTANIDGSDKPTPLVIGKFLNPRTFKNVRNLPVQYKNNSNA